MKWGRSHQRALAGLTQEQFAARWYADQDAWARATTFDQAVKLMGETLEGKRLWNPSIGGRPEQAFEYKETSMLNEDTLQHSKILSRIIREGRVITTDSQGGLIQPGVAWRTKKPIVVTQRAYLNFILEYRRAGAVIEDLIQRNNYQIFYGGHEAKPASTAYPLSWYRLERGRKDYVETAVYAVETPLEWARRLSIPLRRYLHAETLMVVVVDPEPGSNKMWTDLHASLVRNP